MKVDVFRIEMSSPDDVRELEKLMDNKTVKPEEIIAVLGKTEGNGCVNDFTRALSTVSFRELIAERTGWDKKKVSQKVAFVMSGGTEGVMSPHATIFVKKEGGEVVNHPEGRLAVSSGFTRDLFA